MEVARAVNRGGPRQSMLHSPNTGAAPRICSLVPTNPEAAPPAYSAPKRGSLCVVNTPSGSEINNLRVFTCYNSRTISNSYLRWPARAYFRHAAIATDVSANTDGFVLVRFVGSTKLSAIASRRGIPVLANNKNPGSVIQEQQRRRSPGAAKR